MTHTSSNGHFRKIEALGSRNEEAAWFAVADEYLRLAEDKGLFQHPVSRSDDMAKIARETDSGIEISAPYEPHPQERAEGVGAVWEVHMPDGQHAWIRLLDGDRLVLDASELAPGHSAGNKLYHIVANYAWNMEMKFIGDPTGFSDDALYRRTENMLSSALKFQTTRHLEPHPRQLDPDIEGAYPLRWDEGNDRANVAHLVETSYKNILHAVPEIVDLEYNFERERFEFFKGRRSVPQRYFQELADTRRAGKARAGCNTLKRTVLAQSLLQRVSQEQGQ